LCHAYQLIISSYCFLGETIKPRVIVSNSPVYLSTNTFNLLIKCTPYKANFDYKWEKQNGDLPTRTEETNSSHMSIINLLPEDSGEYRCVMSNSTGTVVSDFSKLIVKGM